MEIVALPREEHKYTFKQSSNLDSITWKIGHLRGDFDTDGNGFYTTWFDTNSKLKTKEFMSDLDSVIDSLRDKNNILSNLSDMAKYVSQYPGSMIENDYCKQYGFRIDTDKYVFLLRCNPIKGDYNFYCYCYYKDIYNIHVTKANNGIGFVDGNYNEILRIKDGDSIIVTDCNMNDKELYCRYIDDYHFEVNDDTIYHIYEFAEKVLNNNAQIRIK